MRSWPSPRQFSCDAFRREAASILELVRSRADVRSARNLLFNRLSQYQFDATLEDSSLAADELVTVRDCAHALRGVLNKSADIRAGFSVMAAIWDVAHGVDRPELEPGFFAELIHMVQGVEGRAPFRAPGEVMVDRKLTGREAARARSRGLDQIWNRAQEAMARFPDGLQAQAQARRAKRRSRVVAALGGTSQDWTDWKWHLRHVIKDPATLGRAVPLRPSELAGVTEAHAASVPFGVTPYYASLMDEDPEQGRDRAIRMQVIPGSEYVAEMAAHHGARERACDFMLERDTSPVELVTRRYPAIAILKPFNTCPQICVYCQRNWEIEEAMSPHALAPAHKIEAACQWIEKHPSITEVLLTGGDPLSLSDAQLARLLDRLAAIPTIDLIRIGTRIPVTLPMRITEALADVLSRARRPGRREVAVITHVEHAYEVTPEFVDAVEQLRRRGISVYNQLVYTFFVSRRFEAARLRMLLRRTGVDSYYTFVPKGKEETRMYRVPLARLLQEQKEEARLLPGLRRTDEVVFNVPGLGKNYLRAAQHRDLVSILPDGTRLYDFHPWEKNVVRQQSYLARDVPILHYLSRLATIGENPQDYASIWYYY